MPNLIPYVVLGLALGGVFATSAVGMVVLYKATGVLNLAYGAIGAFCALCAHTLINVLGVEALIAYVLASLLGGAISLGYGAALGPPLSHREPLIKAIATIALMLLLLGAMSALWKSRAYVLTLDSSTWSFQLGGVFITGTQLIAVGLALAITVGASYYLRRSRVGTAMRALSDDRQITAMLGVRVRRIEAVAWFVSGVLAGISGLLLSNLVGLDAVTLTFLVIAALAPALAGRLSNLWVTLSAGIAIGVAQSLITPLAGLSQYRSMTPFLFAIVVLLVFSRRQSLGR
jgi:branched-chain amino acid transport system permease protein